MVLHIRAAGEAFALAFQTPHAPIQVRHGEQYPSRAPLGYRNNTTTNLLEVDPQTAPLVQELLHLYATQHLTHAYLTREEPLVPPPLLQEL